jgi:hypothetical protein
MAESEETGLELQVSFEEESDGDSSFEVIEDPTNPRVSTEWTINILLHAAIALGIVHKLR